MRGTRMTWLIVGCIVLGAATRAQIPPVPAEAATGPSEGRPRVVTSARDPEAARRLLETSQIALRRLSESLGPYPLPQLTIVADRWDSPRAGAASNGEVVATARWLAPIKDRAVDRLLIGAIARQYWSGPLQSADPSHTPFFEGLRQYSAVRAIHEGFVGTHDFSERYFGGFVPYVVRALPLSLKPEDPRPQVRWFPEVEPREADTAPAVAPPGDGARRVVDAMFTVERYIGWPDIQLALSTFLDRRRSGAATPADFAADLQEVTGRDLRSFFDQVLRDDIVFDYGVGEFRSEPSLTGTHPYDTTVTVTRLGSGLFPEIELGVWFEDGTAVRERWHGGDTRTFHFVSRSRAVRARVDPDVMLVLDRDRSNNGRTLASRPLTPVVRWTAQWLTWLENVMLTYASLF